MEALYNTSLDTMRQYATNRIMGHSETNKTTSAEHQVEMQTYKPGGWTEDEGTVSPIALVTSVLLPPLAPVYCQK